MNDVPSSLFDPQQFLETEITGEMATKYVDILPGRYNMQVREITSRRVIPDDSSKKPFTTIEFSCAIDGSERTPTGVTLKELTGRDENFARYKGFLDLTDSGTIDLGPGRNVALGALREATGLNNPLQPFKINMLKGQVFNGEVFLRPDDKNPERKYAEVRNPLPRQ